MNAATKSAIVNALASSATSVALDTLVPEVCTAVELAAMKDEGLVTIVSAFPADGNLVSLTAKGMATIPLGESTTPAQHRVLQELDTAESGQLPTTYLYGLEDVKVTPAVLLEMLARGWVAVECVEAEGETPAGISVSLSGKTGKDGTFTPSKLALEAIDYPVRASATKVAGGPRAARGDTVHLPIPDVFTKAFKERTFNITHKDGVFAIAELGKTFPSLTAAAQAIQTSVNGKATPVNGWAWFGLMAK